VASIHAQRGGELQGAVGNSGVRPNPRLQRRASKAGTGRQAVPEVVRVLCGWRVKARR